MKTIHRKHGNQLNLSFLKNSSKRYMVYSLLILAFLLLVIRFKSILLFLVICSVAALINYFIHTTNIHLHLGHVSFLAVIFSYTLGWQYGIAMILVAHVLAELLAGHADMELLNTGVIYVINVFIAYFLRGVDIMSLGIGLTIFQAITTTALGLFTGAPLHEIITEDGLEFVMLIIYYTSFARSLVGFMG